MLKISLSQCKTAYIVIEYFFQVVQHYLSERRSECPDFDANDATIGREKSTSFPQQRTKVQILCYAHFYLCKVKQNTKTKKTMYTVWLLAWKKGPVWITWWTMIHAEYGNEHNNWQTMKSTLWTASAKLTPHWLRNWTISLPGLRSIGLQ